MDNRPVGIFDSGLGGLTAARALKKLMPNESIIYFGDTGRMPYGGRSAAQIREIAAQNIAFAESFGVKAIIAACGTISSNAADLLEANAVKTIGVLTPGIAELCKSGAKRLGIIATHTSIASGSFQAKAQELAPDARIMALSCPDFVPMIESGHISPEDETVRRTVEKTLNPLKDFGVEALLLGCTHYGIIADAIGDYLGKNVLLAGAADAAAAEMQRYLESENLTAESGGDDIYYTSGSVRDFVALAPLMLGSPVEGLVNHVEPFPLKG